MTEDSDGWLTEADAGKILGRSTTTVKRLRETRQLSYLPGRPVRIRKSDVDDYIARNMVLATVERPIEEQQRISNAETRARALQMKWKQAHRRTRRKPEPKP
jgi:Helix-turn-helix domain